MANPSSNKAALPSSANSPGNQSDSASGYVDPWEAYLVRIDTATLGVPEANLSNSNAQPSAKVTAAAQPQAARANATQTDQLPVSPNEDQGHLEATDEDGDVALRDSIASQMLQAVKWDEGPIDAFIGGFPLLSGGESATAEPSAETCRPAPVKPHAAGDERSPAATCVDLSEEASLEPLSQDDVDVAESDLVSPALEQQSAAATRPAALADEDESQPLSLSPTPETMNISGTQLSPEDVERIVAEYMARQRSSSGAIFRLDRPSYSDPAETTELNAWEDSGEASLSVEVNSHTDLDLELPNEAPERPNFNHQLVEEAEAKLRQAQTPLFSPVWEVDQFQWPEVCVRLIERRADSLNRVANNLFKACQEGLQVMAVTSSQAGEGRTTVACCLAMLAGAHGLRVALVDGDVENPTLCLQTNLEVDADWKASLANQLPLEEVAIQSLDDHVTLIPLLEPIDEQDPAYSPEQFGVMLQRLTHRFDLVIVDMGPMHTPRSTVTDLGEQGLVNAVVMVVDERTSEASRTEQCLVRLQQAGVASVGIVENFVS